MNLGRRSQSVVGVQVRLQKLYVRNVLEPHEAEPSSLLVTTFGNENFTHISPNLKLPPEPHFINVVCEISEVKGCKCYVELQSLLHFVSRFQILLNGVERVPPIPIIR